MTRKEKEKLLINALGLKVGDIINLNFYGDYINNLRVVEEEDRYKLYGECEYHKINISILIVHDYNTVKKTKGELKCSSFESCHKCPLYTLHCENGLKDHLYDILEATKDYYKLDPRIYEAYKSVLDDKVEE